MNQRSILTPSNPLWCIEEVAEYLSLPRSTAYALAKNGTIPSIRIGGRVRFDPEQIEAWLDQQRQLNHVE